MNYTDKSVLCSEAACLTMPSLYTEGGVLTTMYMEMSILTTDVCTEENNNIYTCEMAAKGRGSLSSWFQ